MFSEISIFYDCTCDDDVTKMQFAYMHIEGMKK